MLQTIEAEIDAEGKIHWLEPIHVTTPRRVLITLLSETEAFVPAPDAATKLRQIAERMHTNSFTGNPPRLNREELHDRR